MGDATYAQATVAQATFAHPKLADRQLPRRHLLTPSFAHTTLAHPPWHLLRRQLLRRQLLRWHLLRRQLLTLTCDICSPDLCSLLSGAFAHLDIKHLPIRHLLTWICDFCSPWYTTFAHPALADTSGYPNSQRRRTINIVRPWGPENNRYSWTARWVSTLLTQYSIITRLDDKQYLLTPWATLAPPTISDNRIT